MKRHRYFVSPNDPDLFYILPELGAGPDSARLTKLGWQPVRRAWLRSYMGKKLFDNHIYWTGAGQFYWTGNRAQPHGRGVLADAEVGAGAPN
jgi:hypothetical protein